MRNSCALSLWWIRCIPHNSTCQHVHTKPWTLDNSKQRDKAHINPTNIFFFVLLSLRFALFLSSLPYAMCYVLMAHEENNDVWHRTNAYVNRVILMGNSHQRSMSIYLAVAADSLMTLWVRWRSPPRAVDNEYFGVWCIVFVGFLSTRSNESLCIHSSSVVCLLWIF